MLVLSRRIGEELHIGNSTVVVVQSISGNRVRLGIHAPREVSVLRGELASLDPECIAVDPQAGDAVAESRLNRVARLPR